MDGARAMQVVRLSAACLLTQVLRDKVGLAELGMLRDVIARAVPLATPETDEDRALLDVAGRLIRADEGIPRVDAEWDLRRAAHRALLRCLGDAMGDG